jgi:ribosomal protein S18 acetylase RimI-like enzyme
MLPNLPFYNTLKKIKLDKYWMIDSNRSIHFRPICASDFQEIKALHEEFFPVKYSDSFYKEACQSIGINKSHLFTAIAMDSNKIIGFVFAQFIPLSESEDRSLVKSNAKYLDACYILTLGIKPEYRRTGLASKLLLQCIDYAKLNKQCGVIYLHVIRGNTSAISFYEKNHFEFFREIAGNYNLLL